MKIPAKHIQTGEVTELDSKDILYFITALEGRSIHIQTTEGTYALVKTLGDLKQLLRSEGFDNLDRSNLVNLNKVIIKGYDDATLEGGFSVEVSRRNAHKLD